MFLKCKRQQQLCVIFAFYLEWIINVHILCSHPDLFPSTMGFHMVYWPKSTPVCHLSFLYYQFILKRNIFLLHIQD